MISIYRTPEGEAAVIERYRTLLHSWPVPSEQRTIPTRQGDTFAIASGPPEAPALILLHGAGINSLMWMHDVATWSKAFRVYAVDVIGEPGLSAQSRPSLDSDAYALWLDDVMQGLALERASFVGISLGGWLALDYAIRRPERAARLALLCPAGVGRRNMGFLVQAAFLLLLGPWGRRKAIRLALGAAPKDPSPAMKAVGGLFLLIHRYFRPRQVRIPTFSDRSLAGLRMPLLAILGAKDALLDSGESRRRLQKNAPHAKIIWLAEIGHNIPSQAEPILDFLASETGAKSRGQGMQISASSLILRERLKGQGALEG